MALDVLTATGWKMKRRPNAAYLALFLISAASATSEARIWFADACIDARFVLDESAAACVMVHCYSILSFSVSAVKAREIVHERYPSRRKASSIYVVQSEMAKYAPCAEAARQGVCAERVHRRPVFITIIVECRLVCHFGLLGDKKPLRL